MGDFVTHTEGFQDSAVQQGVVPHGLQGLRQGQVPEAPVVPGRPVLRRDAGDLEGFRPGGQGAWAVVTADGEVTARYSLGEDRTVRLGSGEGYNVLQISGGAAAVVEANCGDHTCIRTGQISREGEAIVCLPHRLVVRIEGGDEPLFDADAG